MTEEEKELRSESQVESLEQKRVAFGSELSSLREKTRLSREDLANLTKISLMFVNSLEEGAFSELPGRVFGRGFLNSILKALDVEDKSLLKLYDQCWANKESKNSKSLSLSFSKLSALKGVRKDSEYKNRHKASIKRLKWFFVPVLVISLAFFSLYIYFDGKAGQDLNKSTNTSQTEISSVVKDDKTIGKLAANKENRAEPFPQDSVSKKTAALSEGDQNIAKPSSSPLLQLTVKEDVQIKRREDGAGFIEQVYKTGVYTFEISSSIELFCPKASSIALQFQGEELDLSEYGDKDVRVRFVNSALEVESLKSAKKESSELKFQ